MRILQIISIHAQNNSPTAGQRDTDHVVVATAGRRRRAAVIRATGAVHRRNAALLVAATVAVGLFVVPAGAANAQCRIDVRASAFHLFIVHRAADGREWYYRGGERGARLVADAGEYKPGSTDWDPGARSRTVQSGPDACAKPCLHAQVRRINQLKLPYKLLEQNSNSVAHTFLAKCGLPENRPIGDWRTGTQVAAPGWNRIL